jgi:oligopeptide transport system ATP-binding protein
MTTPLLSVRDLEVHFPIEDGGSNSRAVRAVDGVSFELATGETVALVGESGCGKSTLARAVVGIQRRTRGSIMLSGFDIQSELDAGGVRRKAMRRRIQMVFQDPAASLNPRMTLEGALTEPFKIHGAHSNATLREKARALFQQVGLDAALLARYPHELSGGQRQRVCIARALAVAPELMICDEATSALDVSVQAQILNLLTELKRELSLSYLFITHDLGVVRQLADRVLVMYLGQLIECASTEQLFEAPAHPYTQALLASVPRVGARANDKRLILVGDVPSPANPPSGCRFHTRCPYAIERCRQSAPELSDFRGEHLVRCHLAGELVTRADGK